MIVGFKCVSTKEYC